MQEIPGLSKSTPTKRKLEIECEFCPYITNRALEFMMHQKTHNTNFHCKKCSFSSSSEFAFEMHMQDNHSQEQQKTCVTCTVCERIFADEEDLKGHTKRQHTTTKETNMCESTEYLKEEKDEYKCDKCTFTSNEDVVFRHHILVTHVPGFECHECNAIIKPDDLAIGCATCDYFFHKKCTNLAQLQGSAWKPETWSCNSCIPNKAEVKECVNKPETHFCPICHYECANMLSIDTHMLNNHCPDLSAQCDVCDKRFRYEDNFKIHIITCYQSSTEASQGESEIKEKQHLTSSKCVKCDKTFSSKSDLDEHANKEDCSLPLNFCQVCQITVKNSELSIRCDHCEFNFHKKCTSLKKATGHWKPSLWKCQFCQNINNQNNPTQIGNGNKLPEVDNSKKLPKLAGKHRKSNAIGCDHPDKDFLESQINTLKSIVAKREAELKKVQESDNLKAKRIMNLEAQLNEARKTVCQVKDFAKDNHDKTSNENQTENIKITNLELKTNSLEQQVTILFSKLETINHAKEEPKVSGKIFSCDLCEAEFQEKVNLKKHKELSHGALYKCDDCPFTTVSPTSLDSHKKTQKRHFSCPSCEFKTENESYLNKHKTKHDMKCDQCSYYQP